MPQEYVLNPPRYNFQPIDLLSERGLQGIKSARLKSFLATTQNPCTPLRPSYVPKFEPPTLLSIIDSFNAAGMSFQSPKPPHVSKMMFSAPLHLQYIVKSVLHSQRRSALRCASLATRYALAGRASFISLSLARSSQPKPFSIHFTFLL